MRTQPPEISDDQVVSLLVTAWGFAATELTYHPYGFGSHHWIATSADSERRFLTVDRHEGASDAGSRTFNALRRAFETAHVLRHRAGCDFVVAPELSRHGRPLEPLGEHYSLAVFPFVVGTTGDFGGGFDAVGGPSAVIDLLVSLHAATTRVPPTVAARDDLAVPGHATLRRALDELDRPWSGGPYSECARSVLASYAASVEHALDHHQALAAQVRESRTTWVITHGEPHPGNLILTPTGVRLIDWDTVLTAPPERDLIELSGGTGVAGERYQRATGRRLDPAALQMYRIRWHLADIAIYVSLFRQAHVTNQDIKHAWRNLNHSLQLV